MKLKVTGKKALAILLVFLMVVGVLPQRTYAAEDLADWQSDNTTFEKVDWKLPTGTKIVNAGMAGPDPLTNVGFSYSGHFTDDQGRTVIKGKYTHYQSITSAVWKNIAFRFDQELYNMIDFTRSYMMNKNEDGHDLFTNASFTRANEKVVPFYTQGSGAQRRDFFLVLNQGVTWDDVMQSGGHVIQTRIYNDDGTTVWSKSSSKSKNPDTQVNYNTYTHSFAVTDLINNREGLVYTNTIPGTDYINSVATRTVFLPEAGKLRVIYQYTKHSMYSNTEAQYKAFRQAFDADFAKFLKEDDQGLVGKVYIRDHAFNPYDNGSKFLPIKREDLNLTAQGANFVFADAKFNVAKNKDGMDAYKVIRVPAGEARDYFFSQSTTGNPVVTVTEYNVDTEKIQKEGFGANESATSFAVDSAFLQDQKPVTYYEYTTTKEMKIPAESKIYLDYAGNKSQDKRLNVLFGDNRALDLSLSEQNAAISLLKQMQYTLDTGMTLAAGTKIQLFNPEGKVDDQSQITMRIETPVKTPDGKITGYQKTYEMTATALPEKIHHNGILQRSDVLSAGVMRKTPEPIIGEIFTDSENLDGMVAAPDTMLEAKYVDASKQNLFVYEDESLVPEGLSEDQKYQLPTTTETVGTQQITVALSSLEKIGQDIYEGYAFETTGINMKQLKKDMPIQFTASRATSVDSDPVVEQVQAKVTFNLNGGTLPLEIPSYEGIKIPNPKNPDPLDKMDYETERLSENSPVVRIVPLNQEYSHVVETGEPNPAYTPNGFEGDNLKKVEGVLADHNGQALTGNALTLRMFPGQEAADGQKAQNPKKEGLVFYGWSTKQLFETAGKSIAEQWASLKEAKTLEETNSDQAYKFTANSPVDESMEVYAVYGPSRVVLHDNDGVDNEGENKDTLEVSINTTDKKTTLPVAKSFTNDEQGKENWQIVGWSTDPKATVPDKIGDTPVTSGAQFTKDELDTLKDENGEINLYAVWKGPVKIHVTKTWTDNKNAAVKVGLMYRTAVGEPGSEIVNSPLAVYRVVPNTVKTLENNEATWENLRGYDDNGFRHSYVAVELNEKTEKYFTNDFVATTIDDWSKLGINIVDTEIQDNVVVKVGYKTQQFLDGVDAYSSATRRTRLDAKGQPVANDIPYYDSYDIVMTNTKVDLDKPIIDNIFTDQSSITITPPSSEGVEKIVVTLPGDKEVTLTNTTSGYTTSDPGYRVSEKDGKIVLDILPAPGFRKGDVVKAVAHKGIATSEGTQTVKDREPSAKPSIDKQGHNDSEGNPTVVATPGLISGTEVPNGTTFELIKKEADGRETVVAGPITKDQIQEDGKITFTPNKDLVPNGTEVFVRQSEPNNTPTLSDGLTIDLAGPEITVDDLVGVVGKPYTQTYSTDENATIQVKDLAPNLSNQDNDKDHTISGTVSAETENQVTLTATDIFGNVTTKTINQKFTKMVIPDPTTPEAPEGYVRVTFNKGNHGTLSLNNVKLDEKKYDVAVGVTLDQAKAQGLVIPTIVPDNNFKAVSENGGWDQPLFTLTEEQQTYAYTAQYEPSRNIIPGTEVPDNPDPEFFVKLTLDANGGTLVAGAGSQEANSYYWVKKNTSVPFVLETATLQDKVFKFWGATAQATENVFPLAVEEADVTVYAIYGEDRPIIPGTETPDNPDPDKYVKLTLDANGGTLVAGAGSQEANSYYWVKKNTTVPSIAETATQENKEFKFWGATAQATENVFPLEVKEADVTVYAIYEDTDVPFDKNNIDKIEFLKDPTKMEYTDGDPLVADGLQIKLTDKNKKEVTIGKDELEEYGVTLTPADGSNLTTQQNGTKLVASVGEKSAESPGTLKVNPKEKLATPTIDDLVEGATEITGTVPGGAGATVTVQTPDGEKTAKVGDDDKWTVTVDNPLEKDQTVTAIAKEDGKLDSDPAEQTVRAKDQTPTPTIDKPIEGATEITGTVPGGAGATVTVQTPDGEKTAKVGDDDKWTVTVDNPLEAGQKITAVATKDGEKPSAPATETVAAKPKTETPVINTPKDGDTTITGTAPKDSTVVVTTPEGEKTTTADENGNWTVDVTDPLNTGDEITATAEEEGKKPSDPVKATVIDKEKTEQPTIVQPKEGDTTITGTAPKDSTVVVTTPEGEKTTTADENGNWTVDVTDPL
ncbi:MAG: Ig-like domain-containing protein, partial [Peptoniphilaceae bacterium]|nr:Ig-like domain-containing protein [Peptoniphilaceae bacterium]